MNARSIVFSLFFLAFAVSGCTTLPDVGPFASTTAGLAAAAGTHYNDVASDVAALKTEKMPSELDSAFEVRKKQVKDAQKLFRETGRNLDRLFAAMTAYSEKVASLAAAGNTGPEAAQSIFDSAQGFAELASISGLPAGGAGDTIANGFKRIADEFTRMQAKDSLKEAVLAAQPGVDAVAEQFEVIYGTAVMQAANSIRNTEMLEASRAAGPNIVGFYEVVEEHYNDYYRVLIGHVADIDPDASPSDWRGFCADAQGPCRPISELQGVSLVDARMNAIRPIVEAYREDVEEIDRRLAQRRKASKAVIKAVRAWRREHEKLYRSLEDGTSLSAFNLKSALIELSNLIEQ